MSTTRPPEGARTAARSAACRPLNTVHRLVAAIALSAAAWPAQAESLRCNGQFTDVGDSRLSVLFKCGEPLLKDAFCAPVFTIANATLTAPPTWVQVPGAVVPCVPVDEWLYDRGPGNLMATVRFQSGVVQAIRYARSPR
jgi:hypothetical protein